MVNVISYQKREKIATITMDDGKANAVSPQLVEELNAALDQAEIDNAVIILTGRPGKLSAGFDLSIANLQFNWDWDKTPSPGKEKSDRTYLFTVGYSWKNL